LSIWLWLVGVLEAVVTTPAAVVLADLGRVLDLQ
jgi:hypothetical protein